MLSGGEELVFLCFYCNMRLVKNCIVWKKRKAFEEKSDHSPNASYQLSLYYDREKKKIKADLHS